MAEQPVTQPHLLVVEDDPEISASLARFLRERGFLVSVADSAENARLLLEQARIDLALLDIMLPGTDGLELCRHLRASSDTRVIMLTALSEPADKVLGLELGADDYVSKPFDLRELLARIRAVLRRPPAGSATRRPVNAEFVLRFDGFAFHPYRRFLRTPKGLRVPLTGTETDLLLVFCQHPREILSRDEMINLTRGEGFAIGSRSIDILVSRLRRKIAGDDPATDPIRTARSDGYVFQTDVTVE